MQDDRTESEIYRDEGYYVAERLFMSEETDALIRRTIDIAEGRAATFQEQDIELEPGAGERNIRTVRKLNRCAENDDVFLAHAKSEKVLDIVESLVGPDIKLYSSQCFMKPPGGVEKPYHQDSAYFTIEPLDLVTCWTALDDVTEDNGCMWVIPGSHRGEILDHSQEWTVGDRTDKQVPDEALDRGRETPIVMPAGSCSFHHSVLLHRSAPNLSERPRRGLAVHYMSARSRWTHATKGQPDYLLVRGREHPGCV